MVYPLSEGRFTVDASKVFIPFDESKDELADRPASLVVDIVPFLIKTKNDLVVIDPGLGFLASESSTGYQIEKNIRQHGFSLGEVTMVLLSHLHKDHAGGISFEKNGD